MRNFITLILAAIISFNTMALNELVQHMGVAYPEGDFYPTVITVPEVRNATANGDFSVFSETDLAYCNYYEALNLFMFMDKPVDADKKLAFNSRVLGDDHYTTLVMKAIYNKINAEGLKNVDAALDAIDEEFGQINWQYPLMQYVKCEILAQNGKVEEGYNLAKSAQETLSKGDMKDHWINGCLHIMQSVLLSALQRWDDMLPPFKNAAEIYANRSTEITNNPNLSGTSTCALIHLGHYLSSISRAFGYHKDAIETSEALMKYLKEMDLLRSGLADEMRCNIAICYYKDKNYKKSRPMMQEYLSILKGKGMEGTPSYQYVDNLYKQTPKK